MISKFAHPSYLNLIWILLIFFIVIYILMQKKIKKFTQVFGDKILGFLAQNTSHNKKKIKLILRIHLLS